MSETAIAFARLCLCGVETVVAFVGAGRAVTETGGAFAAEKWVFLAWFSVAEVMVVSMVAVWGRAVVMAVSMVAVQGRAVVMVVSCWPEPVAVEVSLVASSPRGCVLCAKKFALRGLVVGVCAKKFALRTKNGPKSASCGVLGEFFAEVPLVGPGWASFFAETRLEGRCWASFFAIQQS